MSFLSHQLKPTPKPLPTELLESILLHLDNKTLLLSQRVNRRFRTLITSSPRLQQKLFLAPIPRSSGRNDIPKNKGEVEVDVVVNPLLPLILPPTLRNLASSPFPHSRRFRSLSGPEVVENDEALNRLMLDADTDWRWEEDEEVEWRRGVVGWWRERSGGDGEEEGLRELGGLFREEASWKRMFATQPPCRTVLVWDECCSCVNIGGWQVLREVGFVKGDEEVEGRVRLGEFVGLVLGQAGGKGNGWGVVDWILGPEGDDGKKVGAEVVEPLVLVRTRSWQHCSGENKTVEMGLRGIGRFDEDRIEWDQNGHDLQEFWGTQITNDEEEGVVQGVAARGGGEGGEIEGGGGDV